MTTRRMFTVKMFSNEAGMPMANANGGVSTTGVYATKIQAVCPVPKLAAGWLGLDAAWCLLFWHHASHCRVNARR